MLAYEDAHRQRTEAQNRIIARSQKASEIDFNSFLNQLKNIYTSH